MDSTLAFFTILGGLSAIWFFWDKIKLHSASVMKLFGKKKEDINVLALSDEEFMFIDKFSKNNFVKSYLPVSSEEIQICKSLVNHGLFVKRSDSTYKPTNELKKLLNSLKIT